jgi:peptidoglycan/LPS O-acetylase OafA/YrhL
MRRPDIDLLRVVLCAGVILAHAALIFADEPRYHLKSAVPDAGASLLYAFLRPTLMVSWFILAGWAALKSLRSRGAIRFLRERASRLLVPLAVGTVTVGSVIKYVELSHGRHLGLGGLQLVAPLQESFFTFFPRNLLFLNRVTWSHLYFLAYLFLMSVALLPLLTALLRRSPPARAPSLLPAGAPGLAMAALVVATHGYWPYLPNLIQDWANLLFFALCFAFGAVLAWWPALEARLRDLAPLMALVMVASFAVVLGAPDTVPGRIAVGLLGWSAFATFAAIAHRVRPQGSAALAYLNEAMLPVFIIHHAPLLVIGAWVLPLALPPAVAIALIAASSTVVSLGLYHLLIRPWPVMRFAFGMGPLPAIAQPRPAPAE